MYLIFFFFCFLFIYLSMYLFLVFFYRIIYLNSRWICLLNNRTLCSCPKAIKHFQVQLYSVIKLKSITRFNRAHQFDFFFFFFTLVQCSRDLGYFHFTRVKGVLLQMVLLCSCQGLYRCFISF